MIRAAARTTDPPVWLRFVIVAAVLAGIFFRFYHLDRKTFWEDELFGTIHTMGYTESDIVAHSATLTDGKSLQVYFHLPGANAPERDRLGNTVRALAVEDPQHPPVYYVGGHVWSELFGTSVTALRAFSATASLAAIVAMFWLCRELFPSRAVAWVGAALIALSPFAVLYAQEAREYAMWSGVLLAMSAAFVRACRRGGPAAWTLYGALVAAGAYVYPLTLLVALCFGVYLVCTPAARTRAIVTGYAIASGAAALAFAPWARFIVSDLLVDRGVPRGMSNIFHGRHSVLEIVATFVRNVRNVFVDFGRFSIAHVSSNAVNAVPTALIAVLVVVAFVFLWRATPAPTSRFVIFGLALPAAPLLLHDVFFGGILVDQLRYFIPVFIAAEIAIAALLATKIVEARANRAAWAALTVALLAGEALSCLVSSQAQTWWNKDYEVSRDIAAVINGSRDPIVVSNFDTSRALGLGYYLAPSVALRLHLHCDLCFRDPSLGQPDADLLKGAKAHATVFLLGPSDGAVAASDDPHAARYRYIDVSIYSKTAHPLGMFLPI